jgi:exonuclease SbcD
LEVPPGHEAVLGRALDAIRSDLAEQPVGTRSVVAAHAFVVGGQAGDSERDISTGGVQTVPGTVFDGIDYVALGHLHGRQRLTGRLRYSGSPLPYSFSEHGQVKGAWLVELGAGGVQRADAVDTPVPRPLAVLRGRLAELLADPALARHERSWCQVTLTDPQRPREAMQQIRSRFPEALELRFQPADVPGEVPRTYTERIIGRDDVKLACGFLEHVRRRAAEVAEIVLLQQAVTAVRSVGAEHRVASALTTSRPAEPAPSVTVSSSPTTVGAQLPLENAG